MKRNTPRRRADGKISLIFKDKVRRDGEQDHRITAVFLGLPWKDRFGGDWFGVELEQSEVAPANDNPARAACACDAIEIGEPLVFRNRLRQTKIEDRPLVTEEN